MSQKITILIEKLLAGQRLSAQEIDELKILIQKKPAPVEVEQWLTDNWQAADYQDLPLDYDRLKRRIEQYEAQRTRRKPVINLLRQASVYYRQLAAVLVIPLALSLSYLFFAPPTEPALFTAEAPLGQKAKVELPDGSVVWLNSGSKITYPSNFNQQTRELELNGEAYFDVRKNTGKRFLVHTRLVDVEVTGTKFNLNAYGDEPLTETALLEGHVNLYLKDNANQKLELEPGKMIAYSAATQRASTQELNAEAAIGWKDNRLIFIDDDFYKLAKKIERWYNMEVVYNADAFHSNKLTVKLLEGEQLSKLLQIIESAIGADCRVEGSKIYITKK